MGPEKTGPKKPAVGRRAMLRCHTQDYCLSRGRRRARRSAISPAMTRGCKPIADALDQLGLRVEPFPSLPAMLEAAGERRNPT